MLRKIFNGGRWERVVDLYGYDGYGWNVNLIKKICEKESANAILSMQG